MDLASCMLKPRSCRLHVRQGRHGSDAILGIHALHSLLLGSGNFSSVQLSSLGSIRASLSSVTRC